MYMITVAMHMPQNLLRDVHYYTHNGFSRITACTYYGTRSVADPGGFLGFRGTPLFVVLCACVAGLVRAHERSRKLTFWTAEPPLSKSYIRHCRLLCILVHSTYNTLCSPLCFRCSCVRTYVHVCMEWTVALCALCTSRFTDVCVCVLDLVSM